MTKFPIMKIMLVVFLYAEYAIFIGVLIAHPLAYAKVTIGLYVVIVLIDDIFMFGMKKQMENLARKREFRRFYWTEGSPGGSVFGIPAPMVIRVMDTAVFISLTPLFVLQSEIVRKRMLRKQQRNA